MSENIVWAVIGFVAGCIVGGFAVGRYMGKAYNAKIDQLIDENNRLANEKSDAIVKREKALDIAEQKYDPMIRSLSRDKKPLRELARKYRDPRQDEEMEPLETIEDELVKTIAPGDDKDIRPPFTISAEDFENDQHDSDTVTLSFYTEDGVLADDRDEMVEEPLDKVGEDGLELLRGTPEDVVYFHSDTYDANYEVYVLHGMSYKHSVLGQDDKPVDPEGEDEEEEDDGEEVAMEYMTGVNRRGW